MTPNPERCATCPVAVCYAYPHLCTKHAAEPDRYRPVLDKHNKEASTGVYDDAFKPKPMSAEDRALRKYLGKHGCCGG